jgi:hypothetical protein
MWQLRKLSTNEALSEAGDLPTNWHSIFGLHGFLDDIKDLSWMGPDYKDMGWIKLSEEEEKQIKTDRQLDRINEEKNKALKALEDADLTIGEMFLWKEYVMALEAARLKPDLATNPELPICPNTE